MTNSATAAQHLQDLEDRMIDGDDTVTASELAAARAAAEHEEFAEAGRQTRRERAAAAQAAEDRAQAKLDAAEAIAEDSIDEAIASFADAAIALETVLTKVTEHNGAIDLAVRLLTDAGVPGSDEAEGADYDAHNHSVVFHGTSEAVVIDGRTYARQYPAQWITSLVGHIARAHRLELNGGTPLETKLGEVGGLHYAPPAVRQHLAAA